MHSQIFFFVCLIFVPACRALLCTTTCSFTLSLSTPFYIPDQCGQSTLAGKCLGTIQFWYDRGEYDVYFRADPSSLILTGDNRRSVLLDFSTDTSIFFSYSIDRVCNNLDDCARDLVADMAKEILPRNLNYPAIMNELQPLITGPSRITDYPIFQCYDSNGNTQQCGTSFTQGLCAIEDVVTKNEVSINCDTDDLVGQAYVSIYQSFDDDFATFGVHCNRSFCNTRSTLDATKEVAFRYNITITPDGRLDGSRLLISTLLISLMMLFLFFNQV